MKIELKRVTHNARLSDETPAYAADVWVDGVKRGTTENDGHGGPDLIFPHDLARELNEYAKSLPPIEGYGKPLAQNADILLQGLLDEHLAGKRLKRLMAKSIVYVHDGKAFASPARPTADKGGAVVLNDLPFDKAVKLFLAQE